MGAETRSEDEFLDPLMRNFAGWYRHAAQENMGEIPGLFDAIRGALPGFDSLSLTESGETTRSLKAVFRSPGDGQRLVRYGFDQLSDGQRALIALYSLITLSKGRRTSLFPERRAIAVRGRCAGLGAVSAVSIVLLCEDTQTEAFVRRFLRLRNFKARDINTHSLPDGQRFGEQWVRDMAGIPWWDRGRRDYPLSAVTARKRLWRACQPLVSHVSRRPETCRTRAAVADRSVRGVPQVDALGAGEGVAYGRRATIVNGTVLLARHTRSGQPQS